MDETGARTSVFVSYSRKDAAFADQLVSALSSCGYGVLLDREDIAGGERWKERIDQLILGADVVVFIVSPDSVTSAVCGWEIDRTLTLGKRLLPVLWRSIDDETAPQALTGLNYIRADGAERFHAALQTLSKAIDVDILWVREHTRLVERAIEWAAGGERDERLLRGDDLSSAETWLVERPRLAPEAPPALIAFLQAGRAAQARDMEAERKRIIQTRRLQRVVGALILVAAVVVLVAGFGVSRLIAGLGQRSSHTLAEMARFASNDGQYERAARLARAGLNGADWLLLGFDASNAEAELRRALIGPLDHLFPSNGASLFDIAYSSDGQMIVTGAWDGIASVWEARTGRRLATFGTSVREPHFSIVSVEFSPDDRRLLTGSADGNAIIWDIATQRELTRMTTADDSLKGATFSGDGTRVVTQSNNDDIRIWDAVTGRQLARLGFGDFDVGFTGPLFAPDGRRFITFGETNAHVWDVMDARLIATLPGGRNIQSAKFSPDSARVVTGDLDGLARVWDIAGARLVTTLRGHTGPLTDAIFSPDGRLVATSSWDRTVRVWDSSTGTSMGVFEGHTGDVRRLAFSPDGAMLASGGDDSVVRVWAVARSTLIERYNDLALDSASRSSPLFVLAGHRGALRDLAFSPDGATLASAAEDGATRTWRMTPLIGVRALDADRSGARKAIFSPDSQMVLTVHSGHNRDRALLWDVENGHVRGEISIGGGHVGDAHFDFAQQGGELLVSVDNMVAIYSVESARQRIVFPWSEAYNPVEFSAFSPDSARVVAVSREHLRVWRAADASVLLYLDEPYPQTGYRTAEFSPDGASILVTTNTMGLVRMIAAGDGREIRVFSGHQDDVHSAEFSPDGRRIVTASGDGTARIWDVETGAALVTLRHAEGGVEGAQFSSDGRFVLTSSYRAGRLWDANTGRLIFNLAQSLHASSEHTGQVSAAFSPDGRSIVTTSDDHPTRIWALPEMLRAPQRDLARLACEGPLAHGGAHFAPEELRDAPVLDPHLDGDACHPASFWARFSTYIGFAQRHATDARALLTRQ